MIYQIARHERMKIAPSSHGHALMRGFLYGFLAVLLSSGTHAFPPAPPFEVRGIVRDAYGWPLGNDAEARVLVQSGGETVGIGLVRDSVVPGQNFVVAVPVNGSSTGIPYRDDVGIEGAHFSIVVEVGGSIFPVAQAAVLASARIEPGASVVVDLTLGTDEDGDRIPDEWELWQLELAGITPDGDPLDYFGDGDADGDGTSDYGEYIAGTFAFLRAEGVFLKVVDIEDDGWVTLETFQVGDKTYQIESSRNLTDWDTEDVYLGGDRSSGYGAWTADSDGTINLEVFAGTDATAVFFRLLPQ